jgi:hypothetical protein
MADFLLAAAGFVLAMVALGLVRILRGPAEADRIGSLWRTRSALSCPDPPSRLHKRTCINPHGTDRASKFTALKSYESYEAIS